jgi:choline-sulfatase
MRSRRYAAFHGLGRALALAAILPFLVKCDDPIRREPLRGVLIITLDTTRADLLPVYGGTSFQTPALDQLARAGIVFEQATSSVPLTLPAHCSLFTGLFPMHHGVRDNADAPLADVRVTLAEALHVHGIDSAAFVASAVVGARRGLAQGFGHYSDGHGVRPDARLRRPANVIVDEALAWLDRQGSSPFFGWLHFYDAHAPYSLAEPYRTMYEGVPYLGAIAFMDAQIQRLLRELERRKLVDRTLIVMAGDHGESLGDHGEDGHGIFLYQSTVRVPLIIRMPGVAPKRVPGVVRLVDVMPTVLDAFGFGSPALDGVSLLPLMKGQVTRLDLEAYSESLYPRRFGWSELRALQGDRYKFVSAPRPELYDLDRDPGEQRNIYDDRVDLARAMAARLAIMSGASDGAHASRDSEAPDPDPDTRDRLAALGYVSPARPPRKRSRVRLLDDPKDCIALYNAIARTSAASDHDTAATINDASTVRGGLFDRASSSCSSGLAFLPSLGGTSAAARQPTRPTIRTLHAASR